ncbi:hypothetical protein [Corynebacterium mustelae]|uniref:hypothetical protein n=1 Tax=Corynebacterium mustelae TaxID=571915 RepID=UPI000B0A621D|nr:hypothetical protein [Corynebacterium mustelae]
MRLRSQFRFMLYDAHIAAIVDNTACGYPARQETSKSKHRTRTLPRATRQRKNYGPT